MQKIWYIELKMAITGWFGVLMRDLNKHEDVNKKNCSQPFLVVDFPEIYNMQIAIPLPPHSFTFPSTHTPTHTHTHNLNHTCYLKTHTKTVHKWLIGTCWWKIQASRLFWSHASHFKHVGNIVFFRCLSDIIWRDDPYTEPPVHIPTIILPYIWIRYVVLVVFVLWIVVYLIIIAVHSAAFYEYIPLLTWILCNVDRYNPFFLKKQRKELMYIDHFRVSEHNFNIC